MPNETTKKVYTKDDYLNAIQLAKKYQKDPKDIHEILYHWYQAQATIRVGNTLRPKAFRNRDHHKSKNTPEYIICNPVAEPELLETLKAKGR